jgi:hypothetical protein
MIDVTMRDLEDLIGGPFAPPAGRAQRALYCLWVFSLINGRRDYYPDCMLLNGAPDALVALDQETETDRRKGARRLIEELRA